MSLNLRYQIAPQMREYDRLGHVWLPYIMYFQEPNYCSDVLNTDKRGFRNVIDKNSKRIFDFGVETEDVKCLLVGSSVVFGVGATDDFNTMPSILNEKSNCCWLNFGGRAFSTTQEFILFMLYTPLLRNIEKVVVVSGVNNLVLYYLTNEYPVNVGSFFYSTQFRKSMKKTVSIKRRLSQYLHRFINTTQSTRDQKQERLAEATLYKKILDHDSEKNDLLYAIGRDLMNWKLLSIALKFDFYYFLQPIAHWVRKEPSQEEKSLFAELDQHQGLHWSILKEKTDYNQYLWFSNELRRVCQSYDIEFVDINEELLQYDLSREWIFVDRIHMTNKGYRLVSNIISEHIRK